MSVTDHPCKGLSAAAIAAFEQIAIGQPPTATTRTLRMLRRRELIAFAGMKVVGRDRFGAIELPEYFVPIPVHYQWCTWASEQPDLDDEGPDT